MGKKKEKVKFKYDPYIYKILSLFLFFLELSCNKLMYMDLRNNKKIYNTIAQWAHI